MKESFNSAEGRSVVAADSAADLGQVRGYVLDTSASRVDALEVGGRGRATQVVPWTAITSFGSDAIMVRTAADVVPAATVREIGTLDGALRAIGKRVLTTEGFAAGTVEDVQFDPQTGVVNDLVTDQGIIGAGRVRSIGSYAAVIDAVPWPAPNASDVRR